MKLGFVSAIVPELSLEQVLTFARDEGFGCIEAMCWPVGRAERKFAGVTHVDVSGFTQAKADADRARQRSIDSAIRTGGKVVSSRAGQDLIRGIFGTLFGGGKSR